MLVLEIPINCGCFPLVILPTLFSLTWGVPPDISLPYDPFLFTITLHPGKLFGNLREEFITYPTALVQGYFSSLYLLRWHKLLRAYNNRHDTTRDPPTFFLEQYTIPVCILFLIATITSTHSALLAGQISQLPHLTSTLHLRLRGQTPLALFPQSAVPH